MLSFYECPDTAALSCTSQWKA